MPDIDLDAFRDGQRATWTAGDYPTIATSIAAIGEETARAVATPGTRVLDVAAGDGNVAIPAALAGASVTALDLTPKLIEAGKARAESAGARVEWVEGDAEALPFPDASFDAVTSNFGAMFAPRHDVVAAELTRVTVPGGKVVVTSWALDGLNGSMFKLTGRFAPPPPAGLGTPPQWGDPAYLRELFAPHASSVEVERREVTRHYPSVDEAHAFFTERLGPLVLARTHLEAAGRWDEFSGAYRELLAEFSSPSADGDGIDLVMGYLATEVVRA